VEDQEIQQNQLSGNATKRSSASSSENESRASRPKKSVDTDHQEVEWQFDGVDLERVEAWLNEPTEGLGVAVRAAADKELADTYHDTGDWRLYRAGYALRLRKVDRRRSEATLKSLASATEDGSVRRREISEPLRGADVAALLGKKKPGPVGERLHALVGEREVRTLFEIRTHRRTFDLFDERAGSDSSPGGVVQDTSGDIRRDSSRIGEVALDSSEIPLGDEPLRLARVEVEVDASAPEIYSNLLKGFVESMEEALGLLPVAHSKYETGLLAAGLDPEEDSNVGPIAVEDSLSVGEVAFRVLRKQFALVRAHEGGVRLGEDPEELHDMRVAMRRARSAIQVFRDVLPEEVRSFREELKHFAGILGEVRDLDVQIEQLQARAAEADDEDRAPLLKIVAVLEKRRAAARGPLLQALDSERYERFESSFGEVLRRGPDDAEGSPAGKPVLRAAPDLLSRPYKKWRKAAKRVGEGSHPEEYHDLRKKGKRLRYALEFLSGVYEEKAANKLVKHLKVLQDGLGRHQDLIVSADFLEQVVAEDRKIPPRTAFAMGALAQRDLQEAAELRASLPAWKAYRALRKGNVWEDFEKATKKLRSEAKNSEGAKGK
jgi:triphosphatase